MSFRGSSSHEVAAMHGEFMAFIMDDTSFSIVRNWAERQGYPSASIQQGGPDMFSQMLESAAPPKMAIVDLDGQVDPVNVAGRLVSLCGAENRIVVIGTANDIELYRRYMGTGVVEYLVKPLTPESLSQAMSAALKKNTSSSTEPVESKVVVIIGSRGGIGASTIAVNLGWILAHEHKHSTVLLDLDMQFGTSALSLDLEPGRGLRDIVSSPNRVDGLMIASSMTAESDQFSVLGAEESVDERVEIDGGAIAALLKELKDDFSFIIVDLPRHLIATQKRLLMSASDIILVTELSLAGIRDTLRIKTSLTGLGFAGALHVCGSRTNSSQSGHINQPAFEKGAQVKLSALLPEDHKAMTQSANTGKAVASLYKQSQLAKNLLQLSHVINPSGKNAKDKKKGGLFSNWGSKDKKKQTNKGGAKT